MNEASSDYEISNVDQADTPFLAVYPDRVKANIQRLISLFPNVKQIRPHVKTHKCLRVVQLCMDAGIHKFKCATIAEAEMLALAGASDIMMAYQPVGPKVSRFLNLINTYPGSSFSCLMDNEAVAQGISAKAVNANLTVNLWIDVNVGMDRTGIHPDLCWPLYQLCKKLPNIKVIGLHAYDGHITEPDQRLRMKQAEQAFAPVSDLYKRFKVNQDPEFRVAAGSTPTLLYYAQHTDVECSPGTFIYWDQHYQKTYPELGFHNAAVVVTRVISKPLLATVCLDLGYKAISSEGPESEKVDFIHFPDASVISQSEEHLLIDTGVNQLQLGKLVYGLPYHIGRTCNLYDSCAVITDGKISDYWLHTARKR